MTADIDDEDTKAVAVDRDYAPKITAAEAKRQKHRLKTQSIGFFHKPDMALLWNRAGFKAFVFGQ